jgi:hypothetical protein
MSSETGKLETQIRERRTELQANLQELEHKVKAAIDWRRHFRAHPTAFLGVAIGCGIFLGSASRPRPSYNLPPSVPPEDGPRLRRRSQLSSAWNEIEGGLIGVALSKVKTTLADILPSFEAQLRKRSGVSSHADEDDSETGIQGEGDYAATRRYRRGTERFVATHDIERAAREAAPKNASEARDMAAAEAAGRERARTRDS